MTIRRSRLRGSDIHGVSSARRGVLRLRTLIGRFRRHDATTVVHCAQSAPEAPWVAEMFSTFGNVLVPLADAHREVEARRGRTSGHAPAAACRDLRLA